MPRSEALIKAQTKYFSKMKEDTAFLETRRMSNKRYYDKVKETDDFKQKRAEYRKRYYQLNKEKLNEKQKESRAIKKQDEKEDEENWNNSFTSVLEQKEI